MIELHAVTYSHSYSNNGEAGRSKENGGAEFAEILETGEADDAREDANPGGFDKSNIAELSGGLSEMVTYTYFGTKMMYGTFTGRNFDYAI
ncbi:MAG: hypothetical protein J7M24_04545 [Candidatus Latescibacteria bacterium]|nr:hypothetical protein [Candidatus Latescibacterota bacterium]